MLYPHLERREGVEPSTLVWKTKVLPLNYHRMGIKSRYKLYHPSGSLVRY